MALPNNESEGDNMNDAAKQAGHEIEQADRYAKELDDAAEILQRVHPIGKVKAIGRLEVVAALLDLFPDDQAKVTA